MKIMIFFALNFPVLLFDIAPDKPFTYGALGIGGAVGFGLLLSSVAAGAFLLFRKTLPFAVRAVLAAVLFLVAAGSFSFVAYAVYHDARAEIEYQETVRRQGEARRRMREEITRREKERAAQANSYLQTNSNFR